jgi:ribose transport system substrate-binding protein
MEHKELSGEMNELREKFLTKQVNRRQFLSKVAKLGLSAPVALWYMQVSHLFSPPSVAAAEEILSLKMLEPIKMKDNSKFKTKPPWKIGFANPGVNNSWRVCFQACIEYQKSLTPEIGEWIQTDAGEKAEKQINDIEDLMGKGLDLIMVNPVTSEALTPVVEQIYDTGVPTVTADRWVTTDKVTCRTQSGKQEPVGKYFAEFIGNELGSEGGNLAWVVSIEGVPQHDQRQEGFAKEIKKYPNVKVVGKVTTGTMQAAACKKALSDIVTKNPKIDAVFCDVGWLAPAYLDVFLERGLPIPIITGDDINGWFKLCDKHKVKSVSGSWPVYCGRTAVKATELILKGEPTPEIWWIPLLIITPENRSKWFKPQMPDALWLSTEVPEDWLIKEFKLQEKLT